MLNKELQHKPVMCEEVLSILNPSDGCVYLDGTLGAGGHSRKILESADCSVVGIDKDPTAIELCRDLEKRYGNKFLSINGSFGNLSQHLNSLGINKIDGISNFISGCNTTKYSSSLFFNELFRIISIMVCPLMTVSAFGLFLVSDFNLEPLPAAIMTSFN